jgi:Arc/MetJ-type ribon-helix-helix transcriptional regulator
VRPPTGFAGSAAWAAPRREIMSPATFDKQFTIQVTQQMLSFIDLMADRQRTSRAEVTRQALREYLDNQEKLIGSRSRLGRSVMNQIELVQNRLVRQLNHMSALLLAAVILQQMQRGESGARVMEQIAQLAGQIEEHLPEAEA